MAKPMTRTEQLVGRRRPKDATHRQVLLSRFVKADGGFGASAEPADAWLRPAHLKLRREGLIRKTIDLSIMGSKAFGIWELTERGREPALAAARDVRASRESIAAWGKEVGLAVFAQLRGEAPADDPTTPDGP